MFFIRHLLKRLDVFLQSLGFFLQDGAKFLRTLDFFLNFIGSKFCKGAPFLIKYLIFSRLLFSCNKNSLFFNPLYVANFQTLLGVLDFKRFSASINAKNFDNFDMN